MSTGKFIAIMTGIGIGLWVVRLAFAAIVGLVAYYGFKADFDTASFAAVLAYFIPSIVIGFIDLIPQRKKANQRSQRIR